MAYYWITEAQKYIQSLGFGVTRPPIDNRPQPVRINQWGQDNSFATDHPKNELRFGKGGVDDAEDAEVILHEYGHAIHFAQSFSFASEEAGAISEGFGDYDDRAREPHRAGGADALRGGRRERRPPGVRRPRDPQLTLASPRRRSRRAPPARCRCR
jgi:hypothetical protein